MTLNSDVYQQTWACGLVFKVTSPRQISLDGVTAFWV
jgi:hypothetical protein